MLNFHVKKIRKNGHLRCLFIVGFCVILMDNSISFIRNFLALCQVQVILYSVLPYNLPLFAKWQCYRNISFGATNDHVP